MIKRAKMVAFVLVISMCAYLAAPFFATEVKAEGGQSVGTTYYIDATNGDDSNDGKSPSTAWKTLEKINATVFQPGDTILFKAREEWHGQVWFRGQGTPEHPIRVDMYGDVEVGDELNYPAIHGDGVQRKQGSTGTVMLINPAYWEIRHLQITNDDDWEVDNYDNQYDPVTRLCTNMRDGIMVLLNSDELAPGEEENAGKHIYIEECYIHNVDSVGYWTNGRGNFSPDLNYNNALFSGGIMVFIVGSAKPNLTFNDVRIAHNTLEKVDFMGIGTFDYSDHDYMQKHTITLNHMMKNVYIGYNYLHDIGQGVIDACNLDGGIIEYNVGNVWGRRYASECAGIYPWRCNNTTLRHNIVAYGPSSFPKTTGDGTAWDIDSGLYNVTYEYNYSYKNPMGTVSFLGRNYNTIFRYNIADRDQSYFIKWGWYGRDYTDVYFVNNLLYYDSTSETVPSTAENASRAYRFTGANTNIRNYFQYVNVYFINNLFYDYGNKGTHYFFQGRTSSQDNNFGTAIFQNNYFYEAHNPGVYGNGTIYPPWRVNTSKNTGNYYHNMDGKGTPLPEPKLKGLNANFNEEPPLDKPMNLSDPFWSNFQLQPDSPLIDAGKFVRQMGPRDFFGNELYYGDAPDIGVHEFTEGKTRTVPDYSEPERANLAYGKRITTQYANEISYTLVDGHLENSEDSIHFNWHTPNTNPQYIEIDFGKPTTFNNVRLYEWIMTPVSWTSTSNFAAKRPNLIYYNYEYWDGEKWVVFYDATPDIDRAAGSSVPNTYLNDIFEPVTTTKLRINLLKMHDLVVLREIEVYNLDGNPQPSKPVQTNLVIGAEADPADANAMLDNDYTTTYSGKAGEETISITLPSQVTFNRISIKELTDAINSYRLEAKVNDEWITLAGGTKVGKVNTNLFDAVSASELRFHYTASSAPEIASFDVYLVTSLVKEMYSEPNIVARYTFEQTSGNQLIDSSGKNNNAIMNGIDIIEDPQRGKVAYFGNQGLVNTDYIMANSNSFNFTTSYTISMWLKPDPAFMYAWVATNPAVPFTLYSKGTNANESYSATMFANGLTGAFQCPHVFQRDGSANRGPRWYPTSAGSLDNNYYVQTNKWNHVAFTWDGYYFKAYVNGLHVLCTRVKNPYVDPPKALYAVPSEPLYFGNQKTGTTVNKNPYFGYMDDIIVYSNALSYDQIREIYFQQSVQGISLDKSAITLIAGGQSEKINATVVPENAANKNIIWSTSDPEVATVDNDGVVTSVNEGVAVITATTEDGGFTAECVVTVNPLINVTGVELNKKAVALVIGGEPIQLTATVLPENATYKDVIWSSSNMEVATVSNDGIVTPIGKGKTIITVTTLDGGYSAQCIVTVSSGLNSATLTGPDLVNGLIPFNLTYGLMGVSDITAQNIIISYDEDKFEFVSSEVVPDGIAILESDSSTPGIIKLLIASLGEENAISGDVDILNIVFRSKAGGLGNISVSYAEIANSDGERFTAEPAEKIIDVVDKTELIEAIISALQIHANAVEGIQNGQYPAGTKDKLYNAIAIAAGVRDDASTTSLRVSQAINDLNAAVARFQSLVITDTTGDINNSGGIDLGDLGKIAGHYGVKSGDPRWDAIKDADINDDGEIGLYELAFIARRIFSAN